MIVPGTAVRSYHSKHSNIMSVHAIGTIGEHPLCTDSLTALGFQPGVKATIYNVNCRKCLGKLNPLAIDVYKPIRIERVWPETKTELVAAPNQPMIENVL